MVRRVPGSAGVYKDRRDPNPRLRIWLSEWEHWRIEADDYLELGDHVIVLTSYHGRGKGSGVEIHQQGAHVCELRDGKLVRLEASRVGEGARVGPRLSVRGARPLSPDQTGRYALRADWGPRVGGAKAEWPTDPLTQKPRLAGLLDAPERTRTSTGQTAHKALNLARLPIPPQARGREYSRSGAA